ncbi:MAG TPA: ATP-binding protein [Anaerolineales bacterium]|nr:ATP-binding protein [Anaerolineales bacterium]
MSHSNHLSEAELLFTFVPDIGNALAGVLSATQALMNGAANDPAFRRDLLGDMEDNLHYLRFIYENWVVSGSFRAGEMDLVPRTVEPSTWLTGFLAPWPQRAIDKRLRWEVHVPADHPPARFDQDLVELALENLLSISVAAAPERSQVLVASGYARDGGRLWFEISDQGPELSARMLADVAAGAGPPEIAAPRFADGRFLGLRVANAVARLHGGAITLGESPVFPCSLRMTLRTPAG